MGSPGERPLGFQLSPPSLQPRSPARGRAKRRAWGGGVSQNPCHTLLQPELPAGTRGSRSRLFSSPREQQQNHQPQFGRHKKKARLEGTSRCPGFPRLPPVEPAEAARCPPSPEVGKLAPIAEARSQPPPSGQEGPPKGWSPHPLCDPSRGRHRLTQVPRPGQSLPGPLPSAGGGCQGPAPGCPGSLVAPR